MLTFSHAAWIINNDIIGSGILINNDINNIKKHGYAVFKYDDWFGKKAWIRNGWGKRSCEWQAEVEGS